MSLTPIGEDPVLGMKFFVHDDPDRPTFVYSSRMFDPQPEPESSTPAVTEQAKIIASYGRPEDEPDTHFIDCGPKRLLPQPSTRAGQDWATARAIHDYAMANPDRELLLLVNSSSRAGWFCNAVIAVAKEAGVTVGGTPSRGMTWPNDSRLRVENKNTRGVVPVELMGSL